MKGLAQDSLTTRAVAQADEASKTMKSLNIIMPAFQDGLDAKEKRRSCTEEFRVKLSALRRETVDALKDADGLKKELHRAKDALWSLLEAEGRPWPEARRTL